MLSSCLVLVFSWSLELAGITSSASAVGFGSHVDRWGVGAWEKLLVLDDAVSLLPDGRGSPPTSSASSSSPTNDVAKQPVSREMPAGRLGTAGPTGVQYTPHSHQFPRTRKMFDKGPDQVHTCAPCDF